MSPVSGNSAGAAHYTQSEVAWGPWPEQDSLANVGPVQFHQLVRRFLASSRRERDVTGDLHVGPGDPQMGNFDPF